MEIEPGKLIRSISRYMGVTEFLINQVEHEDIRNFWDKMINGLFLTQVMKDRREDHAEKLLNQLKHLQPCKLWFFSDKKKSNDELTEQPMVSSVLSRWTDIDKNQIPDERHVVWSGH